MAIEEVLLIGGAAGVGKSSVGWEVSALLTRASVAHWHLEGDVLDSAWPRPAGDPSGQALTMRALHALAEVFASEGYYRLVYVQTASVIESDLIAATLGGVQMTGCLLTATQATREERLHRRELGSELDRHLWSTRDVAQRLDREAPDWVKRVNAGERSVSQIAAEIVDAAAWA